MNQTDSETPATKTIFPNGLRVLTALMPHARSVSVSIYVAAGSRYETQPESGVSHFIEHLCFKGTARRPNAQLISEAIDGVGGVLNAATDREYTVYYAKVARQHLALALDVLVDLVRTPIFDATELERERKVVLEELASVADSPGQQVDLLIDELMWPEQPLGWDVGGSKETVEGLTRDMTLGYLARQYVPQSTVVSVAGNVSHEEVADLVAETLGAGGGGSPGSWFPAVDGQTEARCAILNRRSEQAHLALSLRGVPLDHPDRYVMDLLSVLFGEGMSSRLFMELRERQGLCYDVHSYVSHFLDAGAFGVYAAVDPKNGRRALAGLIDQLAKLRDGVPEEELTKAKELTKGRMLLRLEDTRAVSAWLGGQEILAGSVRTPELVVEMIDAITTDDLRRVVNTLLVKSKLNLAVVGPYRSEERFLALLDL